MKCAICNSDNNENILNINCGNFDNSYLYENVRLQHCNTCGHTFNEINLEEYDQLKKYYNQEASFININTNNKNADVSGGEGIYAIERYDALFSEIKNYLNKDSKILDVGCAKGGFLNYLYQKGYKNVMGIDFVDNYIHNKINNNINIIKAYAENLPFVEETFDVIIIDQTLEHILDVDAVIKECKRVLNFNGIICVSVPNALKYYDSFYYDFPYYWFLIREHLHHFDEDHLTLLMNKFDLIKSNSTLFAWSNMMNDSMRLPYFISIFKNCKDESEKNVIKLEDLSKLKNYINNYIKISENKRIIMDSIINKLNIISNSINIWGIGKEFLYLYENTYLKNLKLNLIDNNIYKQQNIKFKNMQIESDSQLLKNNFNDSNLLITAIAHTNNIIDYLVNNNYKGNIISLLFS